MNHAANCAWYCDAEAKRQGRPMTEMSLMQDIERCNHVDCKVMAEIFHYFRRHP